MTASQVTELVATCEIRVALFLPQYGKDAVSGELRGIGTGFIAIEIVGVLAKRLGVELRLVECPTPPKAVEFLKNKACDLAFLGIEPSRATEIDFSPPIFQFDYTYLVPAGSALRGAGDMDRPGIHIAVVRHHASELALRRIVKHAELVGSELPDDTFDLFRAGQADAFAFPRDQLLAFAAKLPGSRVLKDPYGINRVAMAVTKGRAGWLAYVSEFAEEAKASGLVQRAIERAAIPGFEVSPLDESA